MGRDNESSDGGPMPKLSKELLGILACPVCKSGLKQMGEELVCVGCGLRYPIVDGIPYLLPPELMPEELEKRG